MLDQVITSIKNPVVGIIVSENEKFKNKIEDSEYIRWEKFNNVDDALYYILENENIEDIEIIIIDSNIKDKEKLINNQKITNGKMTLVLDLDQFKESELSQYMDYDETSIEKMVNNLENYAIAQKKIKADNIKKVIEAKKDLHNYLDKLIDCKNDEDIKKLIFEMYNIDSQSTKEHIYRTYLSYKTFFTENINKLVESKDLDKLKNLLLTEDYNRLVYSDFNEKVIENIIDKYSKSIILHDIGKTYVDKKILDSNIAYRLNEISDDRRKLYYNVDFKKFNAMKKNLLIDYIEQHTKVSHLLLDSQSKFFKTNDEKSEFLKLSLYMSIAHHSDYITYLQKNNLLNKYNVKIDTDETNKGSIKLAEAIDQFEAIMSERTYKNSEDIRHILEVDEINVYPPHLRSLINDQKSEVLSMYIQVFNNHNNIESFSTESKKIIFENLRAIKENSEFNFNFEIDNNIEKNITNDDFGQV